LPWKLEWIAKWRKFPVTIEGAGKDHSTKGGSRDVSAACYRAVYGADEPLLACMGFDPADVDSLCTRAGLPAEKVSAELLRLELAGRVTVLPGGLYQRLN